jgi:ribokinase
MEKLDFVAIGDIVNDEFIELSPEWTKVVTDTESGRELLAMNFGDKIEFKDFVIVPAVGNSPNAAVSAHRLGLRSALVTDMGDDDEGDQMMRQLEHEGVDRQFIRRHPGKKSNHHYVLRLAPERTILIKHEEYPYSLPDLGEPSWIYFSSVGNNSLPYHQEIATYVKNHPASKLVFQPGSFQIKLGYEVLKSIYEASTLFFCNKEEAQSIVGKKELDIKQLLTAIHEKGPKIVVITDGPRGAYASDGTNAWHMPMYPDIAPPVDRTGAGDSFSSTFTSALALGHDIPTALSWGPINSMSVVQEIGAQKGLLSQEAIQQYLQNAPAEYTPTLL